MYQRAGFYTAGPFFTYTMPGQTQFTRMPSGA